VSTPITFLVPGYPAAASTRGGDAKTTRTLEDGTLKHSVAVAARRAEGGEVRVTAVPGDDIVVLHLQNGLALTLHPEHARDLILAQSGATSQRGGAAAVDGVLVPPSWQWRGLEQTISTRSARGRLGDLALKGFEVIADAATSVFKEHVTGKAQEWVAGQVVEYFDKPEEHREGVYALDRESLPARFDPNRKVPDISGAANEKLLVLVHGTFSSTSGTFGKLWTEHPRLVERLFSDATSGSEGSSGYGHHVYALEHLTLGHSPLENALTLAAALPAGARIHLVTHSRGGLVAEALVRASATGDSNLGAFAREEYRRHREHAQALIDAVRGKDIVVERVVRVACPARGTLLASKRLDAYVSVLGWALDYAGIPAAGELLGFLNGVARYRVDPGLIPGLAAQVPSNPFVQWLHHVEQPVGGELRVLAGDIAGDSIMSWIKTLLTDAFYWTDNDFVVQTSSMYGGTPRRISSTFQLDRGGKVSHFAYFVNKDSATAVVDALTVDTPEKFQRIGMESYAGKDSSGVRAAVDQPEDAVGRAASDPQRPAVIVVPGVFGSHLKDAKGRVWLDWHAANPIARLAHDAGPIEPDGLIEAMYEPLLRALSATHDVIPFAYDWRQAVETSAKALAERLEKALGGRDATGAPVRILAHSSGGLLARAVQLVAPDVWQRWLENAEARLLLLGTPNAGLWAPMQLISGDDTLAGTLTYFTPPFCDAESRQTLASLPGIIQLQAGLLEDPSLQDPTTWRKLAEADVRRVVSASTWHTTVDQRRVLDWGLPDDETFRRLLAAAADLQRRLAAQRDRELARHARQIVVVTGQAPLTAYGYSDSTDEGFSYLYMSAGDGYVTHASTALPGVDAWTVDAPHDQLASSTAAFDGYVELLQRGRTSRLQSAAPAATRGTARGATDAPAKSVRMRPARTPKRPPPPSAGGRLLGTTFEDEEALRDPAALRVTIINGDLSFVPTAMILGHYRSSILTGTEHVMDDLVGCVMQASLDKGQYPDAPGSHQVFVNTRPSTDPRHLPRPQAVVVVGLGEEGKLKPAQLVATVRQGVLAWAQRLSEMGNRPTFDLAATLIGSGGIDMGAAQSAQLVVQGVLEANDRLAGWDEDDGDPARPWPRVAHLSLVEIYLDRAAEAWRGLRISPGAAHHYELHPVVKIALGALPRPIDSSYRGAPYDFIRAETQDGAGGLSIAYTLDTKRARSESRPQPVQAALIKNLIERAADHRTRDADIGRTLFRLLVPLEMEPYLTGNTDVQLEVDSGTAGIPWELLDTHTDGVPDQEPWAVRTKLLRKLKMTEFRAQVADAGREDRILVIGEPLCDPTRYPRLPGALAEARAVDETFRRRSMKPVLLVGDDPGGGPDAQQVITTVVGGDWRIVHIAGHGELPEDFSKDPSKESRLPEPRGVVLSDGVYLGWREISNMRLVPELVFVNCCYLGAKGQLLSAGQAECSKRFATARPRFASSVAEALVGIGVRCVIAAGWAVDDEPARVFAETFYDELLRGQRFIEAAARARRAAASFANSNTWGAYQCYGDPDWTLRPPEGTVETRSGERPEFDQISSPPGLVLALKTIVVEIDHQHRNKDERKRQIDGLVKRFADRFGNIGEVAEAFGNAWKAAGDREAALDWYTRALLANDGTASVHSAEQRANMQVRLAAATVESATAHDRAAVVEQARTDIKAAIASLKRLVESAGKSMERLSLIGSGYKRLAAIAADEHERKASKAETDALDKMEEYYSQAEQIGKERNLNDVYYPAMQRLGAMLARAAGKAVRLDADDLAAIRRALETHADDEPNFWNVAGQVELRVYQALAARNLAGTLTGVIAAFDDLQRRINQPWLWGSISDNAELVLRKYRPSGLPEEEKAAKTLRDYLRKLATVGVPPAASCRMRRRR
jgi:tetratricopeptide (TPR) repeat protein